MLYKLQLLASDASPVADAFYLVRVPDLAALDGVARGLKALTPGAAEYQKEAVPEADVPGNALRADGDYVALGRTISYHDTAFDKVDWSALSLKKADGFD